MAERKTTAEKATEKSVWERLCEPFDPEEIELLPKAKYKDSKNKAECDVCNGYHVFPAVHLSYVGHAGVTMRLNDVVGPDNWHWEPMALTPHGTPLFTDCGLWIKLTVLEASRIGYGDSSGKTGPNAVKEIIGDAIRNAAMRFGIGTYLWSKSERAQAELARQGQDDDAGQPAQQASEQPPADPLRQAKDAVWAEAQRQGISTVEELTEQFALWSEGAPISKADREQLTRFVAWMQTPDKTTTETAPEEAAPLEAEVSA